jgi:hypothetical protein
MQAQAWHSGEQLDTSIAQMQEGAGESGGDVDLLYWRRAAGADVDDAIAYWERRDNDQKWGSWKWTA